MRHYARFCYAFDDYPDPTDGASDAHVARYIAYLAQELRPDTIDNYVSMGVKRYHDDVGLPWRPISERPAARRVMQGVRREHGTGPVNRKLPITTDMLHSMAPHLRITTGGSDAGWTLRGMCIWAAMLTMFFGMLRKGNVTHKRGVSRHVLARRDVDVAPSGQVTLTIHGTKTIQFGERTLRIVLPHVPKHVLCASTAIGLLVSATARQRPTDALFGYYAANGAWHPLEYDELLHELKELMRKTGNDPAAYAAHSFRRGGATHAYLIGLPEHTIRLLGDWKSNVWREYAEVQLHQRQQAAARLASTLGDC